MNSELGVLISQTFAMPLSDILEYYVKVHIIMYLIFSHPNKNTQIVLEGYRILI
jgi:hypothetical protein